MIIQLVSIYILLASSTSVTSLGYDSHTRPACIPKLLNSPFGIDSSLDDTFNPNLGLAANVFSNPSVIHLHDNVYLFGGGYSLHDSSSENTKFPDVGTFFGYFYEEECMVILTTSEIVESDGKSNTLLGNILHWNGGVGWVDTKIMRPFSSSVTNVQTAQEDTVPREDLIIMTSHRPEKSYSTFVAEFNSPSAIGPPKDVKLYRVIYSSDDKAIYTNRLTKNHHQPKTISNPVQEYHQVFPAEYTITAVGFGISWNNLVEDSSIVSSLQWVFRGLSNYFYSIIVPPSSNHHLSRRSNEPIQNHLRRESIGHDEVKTYHKTERLETTVNSVEIYEESLTPFAYEDNKLYWSYSLSPHIVCELDFTSAPDKSVQTSRSSDSRDEDEDEVVCQHRHSSPTKELLSFHSRNLLSDHSLYQNYLPEGSSVLAVDWENAHYRLTGVPAYRLEGYDFYIGVACADVRLKVQEPQSESVSTVFRTVHFFYEQSARPPFQISRLSRPIEHIAGNPHSNNFNLKLHVSTFEFDDVHPEKEEFLMAYGDGLGAYYTTRININEILKEF